MPPKRKRAGRQARWNSTSTPSRRHQALQNSSRMLTCNPRTSTPHRTGRTAHLNTRAPISALPVTRGALLTHSSRLESYNPTPPNSQDQYSVQQLVSPGSSEVSPVSAANLPILHEASEMSSAMAPQTDFQFINDESTCSTLNGPQGNVSHHDESCSKEAASYDLVGSSRVSTLSGGTEDTLFMYYLDQVFYVQFPFYHLQNGQGRGWLFSILRSVKSAYHAALALSERQLLSMPAQTSKITNSLIRLRTQNGHYDITTQEIQIMLNNSYTSKGRARFIHSLEILTSLLQLLFCEVRMTSLGQSLTLIFQCSSFSTAEEKIGRLIFVQLIDSFPHFYRHGCL